MEALTGLLLVYMLIYAGFISALIFGFSKVKTFYPNETAPKTTFSIVVPFRNEDQNLGRLLDSFSRLNYPKELFELIFVDDFSEDFSVNAIHKWRMQNGKFQTTVLENLRLSGSPKKDAISRAVPIINNQWILTTDADCIVPENWLLTLNDYILKNDVEMLAGAVKYDGNNSFLHHFQRMDLLSLQSATIGSFGIENGFMCNGANFAYTKNLFQKLGGFSGNDKMASGDDVFLVQKAVAEFPEKVRYLKSESNIVITKPTESWKELFYQRVRWASKTVAYQSDFGEDLALVVFVGNLCLWIALGFFVSGLTDWKPLLVLFVLKLIPDWILLWQANRFLNGGKFFSPLLSSLLYPFFSVVVALYSLSGTYKWKGRTFSK